MNEATALSGTLVAGFRAKPRGTARGGLLRPGWPLVALLGLYPLWWLLGLGSLAFIVFAVPMAVDLGRRGRLTVPRGFGFWLLFLAWTVGSLLMFPLSPPNTVAGSGAGRALGIALNLASYLAATTALLYVANLPREDFSQRRLLRLLSTLFVVTVAGGLLGVVAPRFQFSAPLEVLLPHSVRSNEYTQALVHPTAAQIQILLGGQRGRPAAPFGYTNFWGNNLAILLPWWIVFMSVGRSRLRKGVALAVCAVALVPVLYSLDRALWLALVLAAAYGLVRTLHVSSLTQGVYVCAAIIAALVFVLTPARTIVAARAAHGESNAIRAFLTRAAVRGAEHSPVVGYGGTRKTRGSNQSIAVGPTPACPQCGNFGIGSNGQLWLVLFAQGFVGAALYILFFVSALRAFVRDRAPIAIAGSLVILLSLFFMFFYIALPSALVLTMIGIGVVVRGRFAPAAPGLPEQGSRIDDAIAAAGGLTAKVQLDAVNLPVADGEHVVVQGRGIAGAAAASAPAAGSSPSVPLDLNTATAEQLDALPGIGPVTAQKILDYRQTHGPFHSAAELESVPGIGARRLAQLKGLVIP